MPTTQPEFVEAPYLKGCPFCHQPPRHLKGWPGCYPERVVCDQCGIYFIATDEESAAQRWNTRAQPTAAQKEEIFSALRGYVHAYAAKEQVGSEVALHLLRDAEANLLQKLSLG